MSGLWMGCEFLILKTRGLLYSFWWSGVSFFLYA
jgi:hypothetical protein